MKKIDQIKRSILYQVSDLNFSFCMILQFVNIEVCEGCYDIMFIWNSIAMSNIIDAYCVYCCAQKMKQSTEKTKEITSKKAYNNRKRYYLNTVAMMHILRHYTHINAYKFSFLFLETMELQSRF